MKKLLNIIIVLILVIVAVKLFIWFIPILILLILAIWGYSKYKIYKFKKNIESEGKFDFTKKESYEETQPENKKENNFNGTVIDVDYEDIKKE